MAYPNDPISITNPTNGTVFTATHYANVADPLELVGAYLGLTTDDEDDTTITGRVVALEQAGGFVAQAKWGTD